MSHPLYLLDSDICIFIRRSRPQQVRARFARSAIGSIVMSPITYGELLFGAQKSADVDRAMAILTNLTRLVPVVALSEQAPDRYGRIRAGLERIGQPIGANDLWIAAHALAADLTLVTNNEREFRRIEGLRVENWATEAG